MNPHANPNLNPRNALGAVAGQPANVQQLMETVRKLEARVTQLEKALVVTADAAVLKSGDAQIKVSFSGIEILSAKDVAVTAGANATLTAGRDLKFSIGANGTIACGKDLKLNAASALQAQSGKETTFTAGKEMSLAGNDEVLVKSGDGTVHVKRNGDITLKGKEIVLNASGGVDVKASKDVLMKGKKILQN